MKKIFLLFVLIFFTTNTLAADLMEVFHQALCCDPRYQRAIAQRLADQESVPINFAPLFPQVFINGQPEMQKTWFSGVGAGGGGYVLKKGYDVNLSMQQTIFDYGQFMALQGARAFAKQADATFNAAIQDLMMRVARAYFAILLDEDNLLYIDATKRAYAKQLEQVTQEYKVGLKTITDVYTAKSSYDTSVASFISAQTTLRDDEENLRAITSIFYPHLAKLSEKFPLVSPKPNDSEAWVKFACRCNWLVNANRYAVDRARFFVKQQFSGHLPTVNVQGIIDKNMFHYTGPSIQTLPGSAQLNSETLNINFTIPIFEGGLVVAQTQQAQYQLSVACQTLEESLRQAINNVRQNYFGVVSGISLVTADLLAIKSTQLSYEGLYAGYRVGTQTLVDVLNQQQKVVQAQKQYATDRYNYVIALLALKQAAGTLNFNDLCAVNAWLQENLTYSPVTAVSDTYDINEIAPKNLNPQDEKELKPGVSENKTPKHLYAKNNKKHSWVVSMNHLKHHHPKKHLA